VAAAHTGTGSGIRRRRERSDATVEDLLTAETLADLRTLFDAPAVDR
jgi:hypothetical protein